MIEIQKQITNNVDNIKKILHSNPAMAYTKINELCTIIGKKYKIIIFLNFPIKSQIYEFDKYGQRNISIIIDKTQTKFLIDRKIIKEYVRRSLNANVKDAYMYEGKEGIKIMFENGERIDVLPHSLHLWCKITTEISTFCDWLLINVYKLNY